MLFELKRIADRLTWQCACRSTGATNRRIVFLSAKTGHNNRTQTPQPNQDQRKPAHARDQFTNATQYQEKDESSNPRGYGWSPELCGACGKHLGWSFHRPADSFYGLIVGELSEG